MAHPSVAAGDMHQKNDRTNSQILIMMNQPNGRGQKNGGAANGFTHKALSLAGSIHIIFLQPEFFTMFQNISKHNDILWFILQFINF